MSNFQVREAGLDDVSAITELARSRITKWQRISDDGQIEDVAYDDLTVYERWLHGGPWMSVETGSLQLSHLRRGAGMPMVVETDGQVVAYAEVYVGGEPTPIGRHLHLTAPTVYTQYMGGSADDALLQWLIDYAGKQHFKRVTANCAANDEQATQFYEKHGMTVIEEVSRMMTPAKSGQVFYKAVEHPDPDAAQIDGWFMNIGRLGSARHQWESLWHGTFDSIPEVKALLTHRLRFNAAGNDAFVLIRQQLYRKRNADVYCWTPKPPTGQLITAICDWANREAYRRLVMPTISSSVKVLGLDAEPDGYREYIYALEL